MMMGSMAMAQIGPNMSAVFEARGAMQSIVKILKRVPRIGMGDGCCVGIPLFFFAD